MIITCKECSTKFNLDDSLVKEQGTNVRCSVCKSVFTAYPSPELEKLRREELLAQAEQALEGDAEDLTEGFNEGAEESIGDKASGDKASDSESPAPSESDELDDISRMFHMTESPEDDLEELDLDSDFQSADSVQSKPEAEEELDFSDLEDSLGLDSETKPEAENSDEELSLDLDLDFNESEEATEEKLDRPDENGLQLEGAEEPQEEKDAEAEDLDLDLDLDLDESLETEENSDDKLDLSELEEHLEADSAEGTSEESTGAATEDQELESIDFEESLELDSETEVAGASGPESEDTAAGGGEGGETEGPFRLVSEPKAVETDELHLELESEEANPSDDKATLSEPPPPGFDSQPGAPTEEPAGGESSEEEKLDLSDIEKMIEEEEGTDGAPAVAGVGAKARVDSGSSRESSEAAELIAEPGREEEGGFEVPEEKEEPEPEDVGRRKRIGTPVWILLILMIVGAAGYGAFFAADRMGIRIPFMDGIGKKVPFIGNLFKPAVEDAGNLKISTVDIAGKFINNSNSGRLFVISGSAKNGYEAPRAMIKIAGSLYSQGKKLVKTEEVFGGNLLSDGELADMDLESIRKRLNNRAGDNKANMNVPPGRVVPFMLVFSDLPENLEEYTIEVKESFPAAAKK